MSDRKPNILMVDDEKSYYDVLNSQLKDWYRLIYAPSERVAHAAIKANDFDLALLDLVFSPGGSAKEGGLKLLPLLRRYKPDMPIIVVTKHGERTNIVEAMKLGAVDFFVKEESNIVEWKKRIDSYLNKKAESLTTQNPKIVAEEKKFLGESASVDQIKRILVKLSKKPDVTVLLTGETGVGKEVAAQYLHAHGARKDKPFKAINLTTITKDLMESRLFGHRKGSFTDARDDKMGLFEEANGGILFLDEIGEIQPDMQVKLLRFLQEKVITPLGGKDILLDVQVVVATNRDLQKEVAKGRFREDLYYRLNQFQIEIPPLRERREDISILLDHYLEKEGESTDILTPEASYYLLNQYVWPGNIRELVSWVKSTCLKLDIMDKDQVTEDLLPRNTLTTEEQESQPKTKETLFISSGDNDWKINAALEELKPIELGLRKYGRKGKVGEELGLSMDQLRYKVEKYYQEIPEIFNQLPAIKEKYKLS